MKTVDGKIKKGPNITDKFLLLSLKLKIAQLLLSDSIETGWQKMQNIWISKKLLTRFLTKAFKRNYIAVASENQLKKRKEMEYMISPCRAGRLPAEFCSPMMFNIFTSDLEKRASREMTQFDDAKIFRIVGTKTDTE